MYPHQLERLTAALAAHRLAALVGTSPANVAYLTGYSPARRITLAVMSAAGTALVIPAIHAPTVAEAGVDADVVVTYGDFAFAYAAVPGDVGERVREWTSRAAVTPAAALAVALDALGVRAGAIGLDDASDLRDALGRRKTVDGAGALLEARQVKGPWEIEALERALIAAEEALNVVIQMLEPGVSEREAAELLEAEVRRRDAIPRDVRITFGTRTALPTAPASARTLRTGDLIRLDAGCLREGYHADVARTAVMGAPEARQEAVFDALARGAEAGIDAIRPGATAGAVFSATVETVRAGGLPDHRQHDVGGGIGLDAREMPDLASGNTSTIEQGMVLTVEAQHYEHGWGGARIKDTVLVTRNGARVMNRSHRGLVVLD